MAAVTGELQYKNIYSSRKVTAIEGRNHGKIHENTLSRSPVFPHILMVTSLDGRLPFSLALLYAILHRIFCKGGRKACMAVFVL